MDLTEGPFALHGEISRITDVARPAHKPEPHHASSGLCLFVELMQNIEIWLHEAHAADMVCVLFGVAQQRYYSIAKERMRCRSR